ncbi:hypothetical protein [uncultured Draconibacterium sp.]|uniref:hypothetical protein n=1 Tax=uncultured Draconibacterium sp. TaxID=1573823 RepID=UPI003216EE69
MKVKILIVIFLISACCITKVQAQENVDIDEMIGFACYYGGEQSKTVKKVTRKLINKKYKNIAKMLTSDNNAERYMSVITLEKLVELNNYKLTEVQKEIINEIKQSKKLVSVCSGCVYFSKVELNTMFSPEMKLFAQNWLNYYFKEE